MRAGTTAGIFVDDGSGVMLVLMCFAATDWPGSHVSAYVS